MSDVIMFITGHDRARELATSALPGAPVVDDLPWAPASRGGRRWAASRLRAVARGTYHLANRVDPVCLPQTGLGA